jgi:predicted phosphodiesterase
VRVAALYDIHGNAPALDAVLDDVRRARVDRIVVGGDVLPGPLPRETLDALARVGVPIDCIIGNGDREVLAHLRGTGSLLPDPFRHLIAWTAKQLRPADVERISSWPATLRLAIDGLGDVLFCHATPRNDVEIFTRLTADEIVIPMLADARAPIVVCGHTHMQFDRRFGSTRVVNAGSVGMPFGEPGAYWLCLGPPAGIELRRTIYDFDAAARAIEASDYPQAKEFAAMNVLSPTPEAEMLERMTAVASAAAPRS